MVAVFFHAVAEFFRPRRNEPLRFRDHNPRSGDAEFPFQQLAIVDSPPFAAIKLPADCPAIEYVAMITEQDDEASRGLRFVQQRWQHLDFIARPASIDLLAFEEVVVHRVDDYADHLAM